MKQTRLPEKPEDPMDVQYYDHIREDLKSCKLLKRD